MCSHNLSGRDSVAKHSLHALLGVFSFCQAVHPLLVVNRADGQSTWPAVTGVWASLQWSGALSFLRCLGVGLGVGASPLAFVGWPWDATEA